jgi:hypothetical protein
MRSLPSMLLRRAGKSEHSAECNAGVASGAWGGVCLNTTFAMLRLR